jgi:actin-related protein
VAKNFDIKIRATNGEQASAAIKKFADEAQKALDAIGKAQDRVAESTKKTGKAFEDTAKSVKAVADTAASNNVKGLSERFDGLEGAAKKTGRTLNDAVGTFQLLGGASGEAGKGLAALGSQIGNVADLFGTLATVLSRNPLLAIAGVTAVAVTAFVNFRGATAEVTKTQEALAKALERTNDLLLTQADRAAIALERTRRVALTGAEGASKSVEELQKQLDTAEKQQKALDATVRRFSSPGGTSAAASIARAADEAAQKKLREAEVAAEQNRAEAARLRSQIGTLQDPAAFAQRDRLFPGRGATQFGTGQSREDLSEEEAVKRAREEAEAVNRIRGEAIERDRQKAREAADEAKRAAEQAAREFEDNEKRIAGLIEKSVEATQRRTASVESYISKLENEAKLGAETNEQREIGLRLFEAQSKLVDELGNKTRDLTEAEKTRIATAVKAKDAYEDQIKKAAQLQQEITRAAQRSTDRLVDFAGDAIFDRLSGRVTNFWDTFRDYGRRTIAQLAAEMVFRPIISPIVSGVVGLGSSLLGGGANAATQSAGSGGLFGGAVGSPISSLFSTGGSLLSSALGGSGGFLQSIGGAIGGALGLGGGSAALGAFSAGAFASTAGATGAAAAAAAGSSLAAGGTLGAAAGSTAAITGGAALLSPLAATGIGALVAIPALLALGGLFGNKKSVGPFASYAAGLQSDGSLTFRGGGEKNGGSMAQMQEATQAFASGIQQVANVLGIFKLPGMNIGVGSNQARGTFFGTAGEESGAVYFGQDPGVAAATYIRRALQGSLKDSSLPGGRLDATSEAARLFARTTGDARADLEFVAVYQGLDKTAAAASTVSTALDKLNADFDKYAKLAADYGLEVERVEKARTEAIENTVASLLAPVSDRLSGVRGLVASLRVGSGSPLSAEQQLAAARSNFEDLSSRAMKGDEAAQSALGDAGRSYLDTARGFFGTTEQYGGVFANVVGQIGDLLTSVRETDPTVKAIVETGEKGAAAVTKALGTLIDEVKNLRAEVRRGNEIPVRVIA